MKEKFVRINTIEGFEDVREWYWISNSDEDKIVNKDNGKMMKIGFDDKGYPKVGLRTINGGKKICRVHVLKAKAFLFGPNPLGYNVVRHLNDVKTDNRLTNLAWGTQSHNMKDCVRNGNFNYEAVVRSGKIAGKINAAKNGAKTGAKNGRKSAKKLSKPVKCLETNIIYPSVREASRQTKIPLSSIGYCCRGECKTAGKYHWEYVNQISES